MADQIQAALEQVRTAVRGHPVVATVATAFACFLLLLMLTQLTTKPSKKKPEFEDFGKDVQGTVSEYIGVG